MATHARQQYFADESSLSKEKREFSIAEEVQQKIDSIEEGAQVNKIETIKVNGSEVQPDENKAVDLTIPGVVDSLDSTSSTDALSARQGKVLYDYIQDVSHIGHFLALWDASTGLPVTDPETSPYIYNTGDFYTVSNVAAAGGTNYKPDGTQYVIGQASTTVDTDNVAVNDFYFYDGTTWRHMKNSGAGSIAVDGSLSTTSTNPVENRVITNALNGKADATDINTKTFFLSSTSDIATAQEAYDWRKAGKNPIICVNNRTYVRNTNGPTFGPFTSSYSDGALFTNKGKQINRYRLSIPVSNDQVASITEQVMSDFVLETSFNAYQYTPTQPGHPATKQYVDDHAGTTYTAGANIQISAQNVISATDTKYTAGTGISIDANNVISNTQTSAEWGNITGTLSDQTDLQNALDGKVNLGENKVFDNTVVEIGKWVQEQGSSSSGHNVTIDPNGEVSTYNVTTGGHNEATLGSANLTLLESSALGGDETTVISQDGITVTEGQTTQTYNFLGNDRIAKLSDISGVAADVNTKTFTLPSNLSSQDALDIAQEAFDWYMDGKTPIIRRVNDFNVYMCVGKNQSGLISPISYWLEFHNVRIGDGTVELGDYHMPSSAVDAIIRFTYDVNTNEVTQVQSVYNQQDFLPTNSTTQVQYTPTRNRDPATKKYVDDSISAISITPSWGDITGTLSDQTDLQNALDGKANITDANTKTFQGYRGIGHLANAQAVYDRISTGKYAIVEVKNGDNNWKGNVVFGPTNVTTGTISSWEYTHADQSSLSGGLYYEEYNKLVMQVADGVVTQAYSSGEVIHNNGHLVVKGDTAPSGPIQGSVWYDTANDKLKTYDGTNWNEVGSGTGDMLYTDFNWQAKTGTAITLDLTSTITPTANFTVNAPSTIKDGQTYILRVNNGATAYTMTLGTNITNPYQESTLLTADGIDQFVFLAIGGNLELQPSDSAATREYVESINGTSGPVTLKTINSTSILGNGNIAVQATLSNITASTIKTGTSTTKYAVTAAGLAGGLVRISNAENNILANGGRLWAGTQEDYEALTSYDEDTVYLTI